MTRGVDPPGSGAGADPAADPDPMPLPPEEPDASLCCGNGCDPCVYDLYGMELDRYRKALRAWRERHPGTG